MNNFQGRETYLMPSSQRTLGPGVVTTTRMIDTFLTPLGPDFRQDDGGVCMSLGK